MIRAWGGLQGSKAHSSGMRQEKKGFFLLWYVVDRHAGRSCDLSSGLQWSLSQQPHAAAGR